MLYVFSRYPGEAFAISEIAGLRRLGVDVTVVSLRDEKTSREHVLVDLETRQLEVRLLSAKVIMSCMRLFAKDPLWTLCEFLRIATENIVSPSHFIKSIFVFLKSPAVAELVGREKFNLVHIFWGHYPAVIIPYLRRSIPAVPITVFLGAYSLTYRIPSGPRVIRIADMILTHFEGHVSEIKEFLGGRCPPVEVIYRGTEAKPIMQLRIPGARNRFQIMVVSRLERKKSVDDAIRAFALAWEKESRLHLKVYGDGPELQYLQRVAAERGVKPVVEFCGFVPHKNVLEEMNLAGVLMLSSLSADEIFPNAVKEALIRRLPCVAYDIRGVAAFNQWGDAIRLVPPGSIDLLAEALIEMTSASDANTERTEIGYRVAERFDIALTSAQRVQFFNELLVISDATRPGEPL